MRMAAHPSTDDLEVHAANPLQLRQLANQLRLWFLLQAMEAFWRA
jgi:hypothetical protein